jgi:hypothetical protein
MKKGRRGRKMTTPVDVSRLTRGVADSCIHGAPTGRGRALEAAGVFVVALGVIGMIYTNLKTTLANDSKSLSWFIYHPLLNTFAFMAVAVTAILQRRAVGYFSTKTHAYMMIVAYLCGCGAAYTIYTNKQATGESHFQSLHSWLGLVLLGLMSVQATVGAIGLDPDWSVGKVQRLLGFSNMRTVHHNAGRLIVTVAFINILFGWGKFYSIGSIQFLSLFSILSLFSVLLWVDTLRDKRVAGRTRGL